ncbi:MAG: hypothetical protein HONBIEJF_02649 [Fimbriimonadaceae bacterium]|nr:hypothetical protein [Fimbriimonadaceae bacterium]
MYPTFMGMVERPFDVNRLRIASPCSMRWEHMEGDERSRYCSACKLSVLNVAGMTRNEVADAVRMREGRLCMRLLRRADGTVVTKDCPVGARAIRLRIARSLAVCSTMFASAIGWTIHSKWKEEMGERAETASPITGKLARSSTPPPDRDTAQPETGMAFPDCKTRPFMGEIARGAEPQWCPDEQR